MEVEIVNKHHSIFGPRGAGIGNEFIVDLAGALLSVIAVLLLLTLKVFVIFWLFYCFTFSYLIFIILMILVFGLSKLIRLLESFLRFRCYLVKLRFFSFLVLFSSFLLT